MDTITNIEGLFRDTVLSLSQQRNPYNLAKTLLEFLESVNEISTIGLYQIHYENIRVKNDPKGREKKEIQQYSNKTNSFNTLKKNEAKSIIPILDLPQNTFIHETMEWVFKFNLQINTTQMLYLKWNIYSQKDLDNVSTILSLYENLSKLIETNQHDTLTGLFNRRSLNNYIEKTITSCREQNKGDSDNHGNPYLSILDIDFFKKINDNYGHLYGDEILLLFAQIMQKCFRHEDYLFRFGGEEFVVLLINTNLGGAVDALERFRQTIENHDFPDNQKVTVSIGFVGIKSDSLPSTLLDDADHALYEAKENGRNQIIQFSAKDTNIPEPELF